MKAVVLAGGRGTRGRPYTDYFPKAMIPVGGAPLIRHVVGHLDSFSSVEEIIVVADFAGQGAQIRNYFQGQDVAGRMRFVQDSQSGTGGDVVHAAGRLRGAGGFVLWFVDNLCALDVDAMKRRFDEQGVAACVATRSRRREETGFARVEGGVVSEFMEKPVLDLPLAECLGIYVLDPGIIDEIGAAPGGGGGGVNLSSDVLERLAAESRVGAYDIGDAEWLDVESPVIVDRNRGRAGRITGLMGRGAAAARAGSRDWRDPGAPLEG